MGSNADFMENGLKPEEYAYPSDSSKIKHRHETVINPTKFHENKTPFFFLIPRRLVMAPGPLDTPKPQKNRILTKFGALGPQVLLNLIHQP